MITFKDRTFCASTNCNNECGRKLTSELLKEYERLNLPDQWDGMLGIAYKYFCGKPDNENSKSESDCKHDSDGSKYDCGYAGSSGEDYLCKKCGEFYK